MKNIRQKQPDLDVTEQQHQAVVIAGLCHDLGHGPWSHTLETVAKRLGADFEHENMSVALLKRIQKSYGLQIEDDVIDAACHYINGENYKDWPKWLSRIVSDQEDDIDLDKFDYLARDMNRSLTLTVPEYGRLISNCMVINGELAYKVSEVPTIDRLFASRSDMFYRVYTHHAVQVLELMVSDALFEAAAVLGLKEKLESPDDFLTLDDRMMLDLQMTEDPRLAKAKEVVVRIMERRLYRRVGELSASPEGEWKNKKPEDVVNEVAKFGDCDISRLRVGLATHRYGVRPKHPLLYIPFYKMNGSVSIVKLEEKDLSSIVPTNFREVSCRVYIDSDDAGEIEKAKKAFAAWKASFNTQNSGEDSV
jgi:HD superfamily phosphohydrolase